MTSNRDTESATGSGGTSSSALIYQAPGPGSWELDTDHQASPHSWLVDELFSPAFEAGFRSFFSRYGLPLETIRAVSVHGWGYTTVRPVGAPEGGSSGPPPDFVLKVLSRVHPEMRRRNRTARSALASQLWLRDAETWHQERSTWLENAYKLLDVELDTLDASELKGHVDAAIGLFGSMMQRHFELIGPALAAGRLMAATAEWQLPMDRLLKLFAGFSPASAGTLKDLDALCDALGNDVASVETVAELRDHSKPVAQMVDDFMRHWGWRLLDDDVHSPAAAEDPERLVTLLQQRRPHRAAPASGPIVAEAELRQSVPAADRDRFDTLLAEARASYGSLDDNSGVVSLTGGACRRSLLEVGRRAINERRIETMDTLWVLGIDELLTLADGGVAPAAAEVTTRLERRQAAADGQPPSVLGDPPTAPPSPDVFPSAMAELTAAMGHFLASKFTNREPQAANGQGGVLTIGGAVVASGHGVGSGEVAGRVVVARDSGTALDLLAPGDILVCPFTSPAWNTVFPLLGGIVTEHGGPIGHTAVMAREFDLPAVVGIGPSNASWHEQTATLTP